MLDLRICLNTPVEFVYHNSDILFRLKIPVLRMLWYNTLSLHSLELTTRHVKVSFGLPQTDCQQARASNAQIFWNPSTDDRINFPLRPRRLTLSSHLVKKAYSRS